MKKTISLILAISMLVVLIVGCTTTPTSTSSTTATTASVTTAATTNVTAPSGLKFGFVYLPPSDELSLVFHNQLDKSAAALNCSMVYSELTAYGPNDWLAGNENIIQAGANGIVTATLSAGMIDLFNTNKVYWATICPIDDSLRAQVMASPYYVGTITADEYSEGYHMGQILYDNGCRSVVALGAPAGMAKQHDDRFNGFMKFGEDHKDFVILATSRDMSPTAFDEILASKGNQIDGVMSTAASASLSASIITAGYEGKIKYVTMGIAGDVRTDLETGLCVGVATQNNSYIQMGNVLLYNACATKTMLTDLGTPIMPPYTWRTTVAELDQFSNNPPGLSNDELKALCAAYNTTATPAELDTAIRTALK